MKKILIIEDDVSIGEVEKDYLDMSGYETDLVNDGAEGLRKSLQNDYALIILDLMLPSVDGYSICREIREVKDTPIIMVTAKNTEMDKVKGFGMGIDDYITKPFSPTELIARVNAHISRYEQLKTSDVGQVNKIEIRGLSIDDDARRVFMNGTEIDLTAKEYELLMLLASTPNKVFSKNEIFNKVWGYDSEKDIPTITVHIRKLREKLEFDPSNPEYIITVWGVGYKFRK
jgi:DNA-binding response OmpR family regulator